jgi:DNA-binding PadR family transcriptional regulator
MEWQSTIQRVRAEFEEMPCLRVTQQMARSLFGLSDGLSERVLDRLSKDGFLECRDGEYRRRHAQP